MPVPFIAAPPPQPVPPPQPPAPTASPTLPPRPSLIHSPAYIELKANVPLTRLPVSPSSSWSYYALGPSSLVPLVFLHGASTTASSFYAQLLALSGRGYRVISASWPPCWTVKEWTRSFKAFLDGLHITQAHMFGFRLGGLLALQFAASCPERVASLMLCSAFAETTPMVATTAYVASLYWMPTWAVRGVLLQTLPQTSLSPEAIDFVVEDSATLTAGDMASRLTLQWTQHKVEPLQAIDQSRVTILTPTEDSHPLLEDLRDRLLATLPEARVAWLKDGGDFPHLSQADQVNMHIVLHLRRVGCEPMSVEAPIHPAADALKQPSPSSASPPPSSSRPSPASHVPAPLFKPARSAIEGGPSTLTGYDAAHDVIDGENSPQELSERYSDGAYEEKRATQDGALPASPVLDEAAETRRRDSLRLQAEVEARLNASRVVEDAERQQRHRASQMKTAVVIASLVHTQPGDGQRLRPAGSAVFDQ